MNPEKSRIFLLDILKRTFADGGAQELFLAGINPPSPVISTSQPWPRLHLIVSGKTTTVCSHENKIAHINQEKGKAIFYPPWAWNYHLRTADCSNLGIIFRESYIRFIYSSQTKEIPANKMDFSVFFHTNNPASEASQGILRALTEISTSNNPDTETARLLANALLRQCYNELHADTGSKSNRRHDTYLAILAYLQENFTTPINRESVAQELNLHPNYLSQVFKQQSRQTFNQYLRTLRLDRSVMLLENTRFSIKEIASRSGFSTTGHFIRVFKKTFMWSPAQYRKMTSQQPEARKTS